MDITAPSHNATTSVYITTANNIVLLHIQSDRTNVLTQITNTSTTLQSAL